MKPAYQKPDFLKLISRKQGQVIFISNHYLLLYLMSTKNTMDFLTTFKHLGDKQKRKKIYCLIQS